MLLIPELDVDGFELAVALDVDLVGAVDHDIGDGRIKKELLDRPQTENLIHDLVEQLLLLNAGQREGAVAQQPIDATRAFFMKLLCRHATGLGQIDTLQELTPNIALELLRIRQLRVSFVGSLRWSSVIGHGYLQKSRSCFLASLSEFCGQRSHISAQGRAGCRLCQRLAIVQALDGARVIIANTGQ